MARGLKSAHLLYTRLPDVEAHILEECNLAEVVANVASLTQEDARQTVAAFGPWQRTLALGWRDWIILCCTGSMLDLQNCPSPGTPPTKTLGKSGPVNPAALSDLRVSLTERALSTGKQARYGPATAANADPKVATVGTEF